MQGEEPALYVSDGFQIRHVEFVLQSDMFRMQLETWVCPLGKILWLELRFGGVSRHMAVDIPHKWTGPPRQSTQTGGSEALNAEFGRHHTGGEGAWEVRGRQSRGIGRSCMER